MADGYGHEQFFGPVRQNPDALRKQLEGPRVIKKGGDEFLSFVLVPSRSPHIFEQQLGRPLRPQPSVVDGEVVPTRSDRISLEDAQRLGFLPTFEIAAAEGTVGAGQYVREAEADETVPVIPEGYMTKEQVLDRLGITLPAPQQQPQGETN